MALSTRRQVALGETPYPWEWAAIQFVLEQLPDTDPYHLWALIDLQDSTGGLHELDLLVLGYAQLYLIEAKGHPGRFAGDSVDWTWTTPDGRDKYLENPRRSTRRKAQILASRLQRALPRDIRAPWVEPLVFLSDPGVEVGLSREGRIGVVTRDNLVAAITHGQYPGADPRRTQRRIDRPTTRAVVQALESLGLRARKGKRHVGQYELGELLAETATYQDRLATHRDLPAQTRRARTYLEPEQTSVERRQHLRRAADREAQLLFQVREHPGVLTYTDYVSDAPLGPTVLFDAFDGGVPLDALLRTSPELPFATRIDLIAQIGRALHHCHRKSVVHGALSPAAVLVRPVPDAPGSFETRLLNFQLGASDDGDITGTAHWTDLTEDAWPLYQAPERRRGTDPRPTVEADVYSLGAVAYLILTGRPPAADLLQLEELLAGRRCLDPRVVDATVPEDIAELIANATHEVLAQRSDDAGTWVELLVDIATEPAPRAPDTSPLDARRGDLVGPYLVEAVLGDGASARVLQVATDDGRTAALKVSLGPDHDERLRAEAGELRKLNHPNIVRLLDEHTFAERTCLLLSLAGKHTLHAELRDQGTLSLDYASRWGEELLSALEHLEAHEVLHRDIKPSNIGIGALGKKARSLHLFDFSLAPAPLTELRVGTAAYRDPFLPARGQWDHAADRYAAAVCLHELLTGARPTVTGHGGGLAVAVAAERFDAGVRAALVAFFARAFGPAPADRHDSAEAMRHAWIACFDGHAAPAIDPDAAGHEPDAEPDLAALPDETIAAIAPDTAIAALPLSTRARNALDRAGLLHARDLLGLADNRLSAIRGVGRKVANEIHAFRTRWHALRPATADPGPALFPGYHGEDLLVGAALAATDAAVLADAGLHSLAQLAAAPAAQLGALASRHGLELAAVRAALASENQRADERDRPTTLAGWISSLIGGKRKRDQHVRALLGLDDASAADPTGEPPAPTALAARLGVTAASIYTALGKARAAWAAHPALPALIERVRAFVEEQGGVAPLPRVARFLAQEIPAGDPASSGEAPAGERLATALVRIVAEVEQAAPEGLRLARLPGREGPPWLLPASRLAADALADLAALGRMADELAARPILAGPAETERALRQVLEAHGSSLDGLGGDKLIRLAASASACAAASPRLELYPRGMAAARALELSAAALGTDLDPDELRRRVRARYPQAEPLPERPALDDVVGVARLRFDPTAGVYRRPGEQRSTMGTRVTSRTRYSQLTPTTIDRRAVTVGDFDDRLRVCLERRTLLVLGVSPDKAEPAARALVRRFGLVRESFDRAFFTALDRRAAAADIDPAVILETDADGPGSDAWHHLVELCSEAADDVARTLLPPPAPLLLTEPGLLARFALTGFLRQLVEASQHDDAQAIVLLIPALGGASSGAPTIEGQLPVPGLIPGQSSWIPAPWLTDHDHHAA